MFTLKNKYGNVFHKVNGERERDELLKSGFTLVENEVNFDKMKTEELDEYAVKNGIDLSECKNKAEKLAKIAEEKAAAEAK